MADKEPKRYPIETLEDLLQVPPDRLDDCLADIRDYLELIRPLSALIDMAKYVAEADGEAIEEDVKHGPFIWIDDGEPGGGGIATIRLQETDDEGLEINIRKSSK